MASGIRLLKSVRVVDRADGWTEVRYRGMVAARPPGMMADAMVGSDSGPLPFIELSTMTRWVSLYRRMWYSHPAMEFGERFISRWRRLKGIPEGNRNPSLPANADDMPAEELLLDQLTRMAQGAAEGWIGEQGPEAPAWIEMFAGGVLGEPSTRDLFAGLTPVAFDQTRRWFGLDSISDERSRHIKQDVKIAVSFRDGGRCTATLEDGTRCPETTNLHFDHRYRSA